MYCTVRRNVSAVMAAFVAVLLPAVVSVSAVRADVITSADFYFAYGAYVTGANSWTTDETSSLNSPITQGSFSFSPAPTGAHFSGEGPTFINANLATGAPGDVSGWLGVFSQSGFSVPITAQYLGAAPGNAAAVPNYRLELEITNVQVWAADATAAGSNADGFFAWTETTAGHLQDQDYVNVPTNNSFGNAAGFEQVAWNPNDYDVAIANVNDSFVRTLGIRFSTGGNDYRYGDGLEITGRVHLIYDAVAVPEPSGVTILAAGLLGLLACVRRRGK